MSCWSNPQVTIFLSTLSLRRATMVRQPTPTRDNKFLSTLSLRRATLGNVVAGLPMSNFYPRSPCGERRTRHICKARSKHFYPRSPCGERLPAKIYRISSEIFLSTLSLRRATLPLPACKHTRDDFYPRSPCGERRIQPQRAVLVAPFLSTLSLRRATKYPRGRYGPGRISIHALLAESDDAGVHVQRLAAHISIHALLAESDIVTAALAASWLLFLSTLSLRRATSRMWGITA